MTSRAWLVPVCAAAAAAGLWLLFAPPTPDLAAQVYRAGLFEEHGFTLFNAYWYGGHHTPGYSLAFPPLAALLGPRVVGALAAIVSAYLFALLVKEHFGGRAWLGAVWFGLATATDLFIGRLTFGLGIALALAALLALQRGRPRLGLGLAAATTCASPVAGMFLAMAGLAHALAQAGRLRRGAQRAVTAAARARGLPVAAAAFAPALLLAVAVPEGGRQPFGLRDFVLAIAAIGAVLALLPRTERALRTGAAIYLAATAAAFAVAAPMGANATRLAALFAGPILLCAAAGRVRPRTLALVAVPLLAWQWHAPITETIKGAGDPSSRAAFYQPMLAFLEGRADAATRVEVPFTRMHWEAVHVARRLPLARGWETQLDTKLNPLFREPGALTAERYQHWLKANGVEYVALPRVPLDPAGEQEQRLVDGGLPWLRRVYADRHWRVYEVEGATGIAGDGATVTDLDPDAFTLRAHRPGRHVVKVRWTPYWTGACVSRAPGGWTAVHAPRAGDIRVSARIRIGGRCSAAAS